MKKGLNRHIKFGVRNLWTLQRPSWVPWVFPYTVADHPRSDPLSFRGRKIRFPAYRKTSPQQSNDWYSSFISPFWHSGNNCTQMVYKHTWPHSWHPGSRPPVARVFGFLKTSRCGRSYGTQRDISAANAICSPPLPWNRSPAVSIFTVRKFRPAEPLFSAAVVLHCCGGDSMGCHWDCFRVAIFATAKGPSSVIYSGRLFDISEQRVAVVL